MTYASQDHRAKCLRDHTRECFAVIPETGSHIHQRVNHIGLVNSTYTLSPSCIQLDLSPSEWITQGLRQQTPVAFEYMSLWATLQQHCP